MATTRLSDGQPLTYEKINSIIANIEELEGSVTNLKRSSGTTSTNTNYPNIDVQIGTTNFNSSNNLLIQAGSQSISNTGKSLILTVDIGFAGFNQVPVVTCTVSVTDYAGVVPPSIIIENINTKGFSAKIKLDESVPTNKNITLNYLAIGRAS